MKVIEAKRILGDLEKRIDVIKADNVENSKPQNRDFKKARENQLRIAELNRIKDMVHELLLEPRKEGVYELQKKASFS